MSETDPAFVAKLKDTWWLPELPETEAFEVLDRLRELEHSVVVPAKELRAWEDIRLSDYKDGLAKVDNDIEVYDTHRYTPLVTAEHATDPVRSDDSGADHGTGALALLLTERAGASAIVTLGRQTKKLGENLDLPFWNKMRQLLPRSSGLGSIHGMGSGKVFDLRDTTEIHVVLGLGHKGEKWEPNQQSRVVAEGVAKFAAGLGLRAIIGNDHMGRIRQYDPQTKGYVLEEGKPKIFNLRAGAAGSSVNVAYDIMAEYGQQKPAVQLELARLLRLLPMDFEDGWHKDEKARAMGVYSGVLLAEKLLRLLQASAVA